MSFYTAIYQFVPETEVELRLEVGDVVEVLNQQGEWWEGRTQDGRAGLFPANRVTPYVGPAATEYVEPAAVQVAYAQPSFSQPTAAGKRGYEYKEKEARPPKEKNFAAPIIENVAPKRPAPKSSLGYVSLFVRVGVELVCC